MKKIKTIADAFAVLKITAKEISDFNFLPEEIRKYLFNHYLLIHVVKAINFVENKNSHWEPDWNDDDQNKYYPWPVVDASDAQPSGFGFSRSAYNYSYSDSDVGSRLCFISSDAALYALKQFEELYLENQLIRK